MKNVFDCYTGTKKDLETDLKLLKLSYVDLVIVHFPPISSMITRSCNNWSGGCQMVRAQWKAMTEFYSEGKARAIGVSNYCPSCYECLEAMDNLTMPMVNQARSLWKNDELCRNPESSSNKGEEIYTFHAVSIHLMLFSWLPCATHQFAS